MWNLADFTRVDLTNANLQDESQLMQKLPREIRHRIYEFALNDTVTVNIGPQTKNAYKMGLPAAPTLMLTCKQVYAESIKLYWTNSTFRFPYATSTNFVTWSSKIRRRRRELLTDVEIRNPPTDRISDSRPEARWMQLDLKMDAVRGESILKECRADRRGIAVGVIKTNLFLPSSEPAAWRGLTPLTQEIWTAEPRKTVIPYL
ncbi:hypothetical protein AC578_3969 [Pseudocercospora eumusae]|uniref:2EXR domain-containing protein n=1 Tax=Pseudocercospora eumusae TaxID=321146 RepID=A0A139HLK2_9PEZI|nr:hypothetical protein AC578_3969 [Pseudocercospora eumusae]